MTKVATSVAVGFLTIAIVPAIGVSARIAMAHGPKSAAPTTIASTPSPARAPTTTTTQHRATVSTPRRGTATSTVAKSGAVTKPRPRTVRTTTTSSPAQLAAARRQALEVCLQLAAADNFQVIAANEAWFGQQLRGLSARRALAARQYAALQIEESQAQTEIQAQHSIDDANCYLKGR